MQVEVFGSNFFHRTAQRIGSQISNIFEIGPAGPEIWPFFIFGLKIGPKFATYWVVTETTFSSNIVVLVTPQNLAKSREPTEVSFGSTMHHFGIFFFQISNGHGGHVSKSKWITIDMNTFFAPIYHGMMEIIKSVTSQEHFYIRPYFKAQVHSAHPVLVQSCLQYLKK